jgi:hypothetical protein
MKKIDAYYEDDFIDFVMQNSQNNDDYLFTLMYWQDPSDFLDTPWLRIGSRHCSHL